MSRYADLARVKAGLAERVVRPATLSSWPEECVVDEEEWLVEGVIPRKGYAGIFGRRGSAKSFLALHLAGCGATGTPFMGFAVERFGTMYCVGEKKARFGKRVHAWLQANNQGGAPLAISFRWSVPNLLDEAEVSAFIDEIEAAKVEFLRRGAPLGVVVIDTLARALKHANVSDADAAGKALEAIQLIVDQTGVTVMPLAHVAKSEGALSFKGAGEWEDAADSLIRIDRKDTDPVRIATVPKQGDGPDGQVFGFDLEVIRVGTSRRGRDITSCVVRSVDVADGGTKSRQVRLTPQAETVLLAFARIEDAGQTESVPFVPGRKPGTVGVRLSKLRQTAFELGLQKASEPAPDAPKAEHSKWLEARKKAFQRALEKLQEARKVQHEGDFVWRS